MGEAPTHPHAVARSSFADVEGVPQPAPAPRFDRTPTDAPRAALEDVDPTEVLTAWGAPSVVVDLVVGAAAPQ